MKINPIHVFRKHGGQLRMSEALDNGITRYMLYSLRDKGIIKSISKGVYRLACLPPISNPDLVTVALRFPNAVVCLLSAFAFHEITTTQIPHEVSIAVPRNSRLPSLDYPPLRVHRFERRSYQAGIQEHHIDGASVKIYSPEKTLVGSFKFRNQIGMDIVLEALKLYKSRMPFDYKKVLEYDKGCRVDRIMTPYLEANL